MNKKLLFLLIVLSLFSTKMNCMDFGNYFRDGDDLFPYVSGFGYDLGNINFIFSNDEEISQNQQIQPIQTPENLDEFNLQMQGERLHIISPIVIQQDIPVISAISMVPAQQIHKEVGIKKEENPEKIDLFENKKREFPKKRTKRLKRRKPVEEDINEYEPSASESEDEEADQMYDLVDEFKDFRVKPDRFVSPQKSKIKLVVPKKIKPEKRKVKKKQEKERKRKKCRFCGLLVKRLDKHLLYSHPKEEPYSCEICGKSFSLKKDLWGHMDEGHRYICNCRVHSDKFKQKRCLKRFSTKQELKDHQRDVHLYKKRGRPSKKDIERKKRKLKK